MKSNKFASAFWREIGKLGFALSDSDSEQDEDGWIKSQFTKEGTPRKNLIIERHLQYGIHFFINSLPESRKYHFATSAPVDEEKTLRLLTGYLKATNEGKKYRGR